jgi:hypothetical protein
MHPPREEEAAEMRILLLTSKISRITILPFLREAILMEIFQSGLTVPVQKVWIPTKEKVSDLTGLLKPAVIS